MKTVSFFLTIFLISFTLKAQDITGQWNGILKVQGMQLALVFNVEKTENGYRSTMDSPDQGQKDIPVTNTTFESPKVKFELKKMRIEYYGELKGDKIVGMYRQGKHEFPMDLSREVVVKEVVKRPQEPMEPYPYYSEDVTFQNRKGNITLSGTLTLPEKEGIFPVAILITGSGPQNRDEEILGHKPFLIIADHLTKNGIGVLRFDDRGVGQSTGDFNTATSADFATDVESAVEYLKTRTEVDKNMIGLIGHSEGGIIAPMVASKSKDVNFMVLLAGSGIRGDKILLLQEELIARASGASEKDIDEFIWNSNTVFQMIMHSTDNLKLKTDLTTLFNEMLDNDMNIEILDGMTRDEFVSSYVDDLINPWRQYFLKHDPAPTLAKVTCPVLAVNGGKDLQVPPKENLIAIEEALKNGGNRNVTIKEFANLNHLFQECETGLPSEYATIEQTFSPVVLGEITKWLKIQTK